MQLRTEEACGAYVDVELKRLTESQPGWHATRSVQVPRAPLTWNIGRAGGEGWYTLEARLNDQEFVIWFGNHEVGAEGLHWIMWPAVHVAFDDLWPRSDPVAIRYSLRDVLDHMIASLASPPQLRFRFAMNTLSLT